MNVQYGTNVKAAIEDPNGPPGRSRGGVDITTPVVPHSGSDYNGTGPSPYAQNSSTPDPLDEAFWGVGPEG